MSYIKNTRFKGWLAGTLIEGYMDQELLVRIGFKIQAWVVPVTLHYG